MMGKNRETFEAAFKGWHPGKTGPYIKHIAEYFWNQSRQAIEVELPDCKNAQAESDLGELSSALAFNLCLLECSQSITSLGIRVKGNEE